MESKVEQIPNSSDQNEKQKDQEYTEEDLKSKINDLGALEMFIFDNSDGVIGGKSKDTPIDEKFEEKMKEASDIRTKIEIVESLYAYFLFNDDIVYQKRAYEKYINEQVSESMNEFEKKANKLLSRHPAYARAIVGYVGDRLNLCNRNINFLEGDYRETGSEDIINAIPRVLKATYELLCEELDLLAKIIDYVEKSEEIKGRKSRVDFLSNFIKNGLIRNAEDLYEITNLNFYKDRLKCKNGKEGSDLSNGLDLINLSNVGIDTLREVDELYSRGDFEKLAHYIDQLPLRDKNYLLKIESLSEAYLMYLRDKNILSGIEELSSNDCLIYLNSIRDNQVKSTVEALILDFNSSLKDSNKQSTRIESFIENDLERLLSSSSLSDGYFALRVLKGLNLGALENLKGKVNQACDRGFSSLGNRVIRIIERKINQSISREHNLDLDELRSIDREIFNLIEKKLIKVNKSKNPENGKVNKSKNPENGEDRREFTCVLNYDMKDTKNVEKFLENCINAGIDDEGGSKRSVESKKLELGNKKEFQIPKEKKQEMQSQLDKVGLKVNVTDDGKIVGKNGEEFVRQNVGIKGRIEVNANGELILINSLGYRMRYQNNSIGLEKFLENLRMFDYINKIGLGYFGSNFRHMLESIKTYLPNQASYLSIDENNGDFLSIKELNEIVIPIFKNIGFIDDSQNLDYLAPDEITDTVMSHRLSKIEGGSSFQKGASFNKDIFGKLLQQKNEV